MKVIDTETDSIHKVREIKFDEGIVIMESKRYGCTRQDLDKVILIKEQHDPDILDLDEV